MKRNYFLVGIMFIFSMNSMAGAKYAVLIGINNYYKNENKKKVIDPGNSLHGCVNDARSMKELITSRFGFKPGNIIELYDSVATKQRILKELNALLKRCKPGDAAVVYYSGHGMTFSYGPNAAQTAEVICPSDIFTSVNFLNNNGYEYSFIQTSELAALFNKFVDKKVILTAIFDCCYSSGTTGFKKTINSKVLLNGMTKIVQKDFWQERVEMNTVVQFVAREGLIEFSAQDRVETNRCDEKSVQEDLNTWLNHYGYAGLRKFCPGDTITWTNDFEKNKWKYTCGAARSIMVKFTARDSCGHSDTTSATFTVIDTTRPELLMTARDTIVKCCGPDNRAALAGWLSRNGGALAADACSNVTWKNNFEQVKNDFDSSGSVIVNFTVTDACNNSRSMSATFTVEDKNKPIEYSLTTQESKAIISFLGNLDDIKQHVKDYNFIENKYLEQPILDKLKFLDSLKQRVYKKTKYDVTGNLDPIAGTLLMTNLQNNIDDLLMLLNAIPYKEEYQFTENRVPADTNSSMHANLLNGNVVTFKEISFKDFNAFKNMGTAAQVSTQGFPYKEYEFNPPSQVSGSRFLFLSATNDKQKAVETADENGVKHGVFTKVLIEILKNNPADITSVAVLEKMLQQFSIRHIAQTPGFRAAEIRKRQNFFGIK